MRGGMRGCETCLVDHPLELALREERVLEVDAREAPNLNVPQFEVREEPRVLGVAVRVLAVAEGVSHALHRVDDRASQVVRWVDLVLCAGRVMGRQVGSVQRRGGARVRGGDLGGGQGGIRAGGVRGGEVRGGGVTRGGVTRGGGQGRGSQEGVAVGGGGGGAQ